ncbi:PE domain-containing protein [Mycobacterium sp. 1465703.0]|uniref:PPE family protein, SVP subgroup n=1 Tax=Mycobacterium sp. 1465703.0 TaxID=1834078 RepID=UPI0007FD582D|nr:PE domain-containing protein [Mycobacterium sp. 1465703.0]OBJ10830.1 PE family protein [Mycobacterium sp. 1465703.0]
MSYLTTMPEAIAAAAAQLEGIGNSFTAESSAASGSTTALAPAASDEVSALTAGIFSTYGQLYQSVSAEASAIHQQFASMLGTSSSSYSETEAANQVGTAASSLSGATSSAASSATSSSGGLAGLIEDLANFLGDDSATGLSSSFSNILNIGAGNWMSACSDLLGMAGGGLLPAAASDTGDAAAAAGAADLAASNTPAAPGMGVMPAAAMGQATMVANKLSVPPNWAGVAPVTGSPATAVETVGWTAAPPQAGAQMVVPGMPGMAARSSAGLGAPRYGVKPLVMRKQPIV